MSVVDQPVQTPAGEGIINVAYFTSRDIIVGVVTRPRVGQSKHLCFIPGKRCFSSPKRPHCLCVPSSLRLKAYRARREADRHLQLVPRLRRSVATHSLPNILHVVHRDRYTFTSIFATFRAQLFTNWLTPWSRVLLEQLTGRQLVKKFPALYGPRRFITASTIARHLSLSWAQLSTHSRIQYCYCVGQITFQCTKTDILTRLPCSQVDKDDFAGELAASIIYASFITKSFILLYTTFSWGGIATCYELEVRGSNPGGGEILSTRPERPWGLSSLLYNGYRVIPGDKAAGAWRWPPTPI
jgi:hypothetical protein